MYILDYVKCGYTGGAEPIIGKMDIMIPTITSMIVTFIRIGVPIILIVLGMLDFGKAVMAQKEDEIKKNQQLFVKRLISAVIVYLVVMVVQLVFNIVGKDNESGDMWNCISCFVNGPTEKATATAKGDTAVGCRID